MSYEIFCIGVDSSARMTKDKYYFLYKDTQFQFISSKKPNETDRLNGKFSTKLGITAQYKIVTEFLSAFAFSHDIMVDPVPGMTNHANLNLRDFEGGFSALKKIPYQESFEDFYYIAHVDNEDKSEVLRLYREAQVSNSVYLKILFYWHIMEYKNSGEKGAIEYINDFLQNNSDGQYLQTDVAGVNENKIFDPSNTFSDLGTYIHQGIRHSIAHIERKPTTAKNLFMDDILEIRHLNQIVNILEIVSRNKIIEFHHVEENSPLNVFTYYDPNSPPY